MQINNINNKTNFGEIYLPPALYSSMKRNSGRLTTDYLRGLTVGGGHGKIFQEIDGGYYLVLPACATKGKYRTTYLGSSPSAESIIESIESLNRAFHRWGYFV